MLNHPTLDQLKAMRLTGMAQAFEEQLHDSNVDALSFDDRLAFLVEREHTLRSNRQLANRLRRAKLKLQATLEDLDFHARRGLDKTRIRELANSAASSKTISTCLSPGPPASVKLTSPVPSLTQPAAMASPLAICDSPDYFTTSASPAATAPIPGSSPNLRRPISSSLMTGAWHRSMPNNARDLLDILDDRHATRSTAVTSQLPVKQWHDIIGEPTLADAILDRLVHNAYTLNLKGESMRKKHNNLTQPDHLAQ